MEVWGTGPCHRDLLYIEDASRGVVEALERYDDGRPVNLSSGREVRIRDLAELIARLTGFQGSISWDTRRPDGQPRRSLDTNRAKRYFGFEAAIELEEGLRRTIAWWERQSR